MVLFILVMVHTCRSVFKLNKVMVLVEPVEDGQINGTIIQQIKSGISEGQVFRMTFQGHVLFR